MTAGRVYNEPLSNGGNFEFHVVGSALDATHALRVYVRQAIGLGARLDGARFFAHLTVL